MSFGPEGKEVPEMFDPAVKPWLAILTLAGKFARELVLDNGVVSTLLPLAVRLMEGVECNGPEEVGICAEDIDDDVDISMMTFRRVAGESVELVQKFPAWSTVTVVFRKPLNFTDWQ